MWIQSPAELTGDGAPRSLLFAETEVGLETVKQSEVSQKEKHQYSIIIHICGI